MKSLFLSGSIALAAFTFGGAAYACDMHGAGFSGFGLSNAPWQTYDPLVSTTDPSLSDEQQMTSIPRNAVPPAKAKPSFSNAANMAAMKAKARLAKKEGKPEADKEAAVQKAALKTDR